MVMDGMAPCPKCGAQVALSAVRCHSCGRTQLVDVRLRAPIADERQRFYAAKRLGELGPPAPRADRARELLKTAGALLGRGVARQFAQQLAEALEPHGGQVDTSLAGPERRGTLFAAAGALVLTALCVGGYALVNERRQSPAAMPTPTVVVQPTAVAAVAQPSVVTTQQIAQQTLDATVSISCGNSIGTGFFVKADLVLTNAHVACPVGQSQLVTLHDKRVISGQTQFRDDTLDVATVQLLGTKIKPLPLGDGTQSAPGDRVVFIGTPKGLSFTVHEGKISFVGRAYMGVGYLQFDASVNPGNSGGPLLNDRGEVVGIVSLKLANAEGIGLALPVQYANTALGLSMKAAAATRWLDFQAKMKKDEGTDLARFDVPKERPSIVAVEATEVGLVAVILERRDHPPAYVDRQFELRWVGGYCGDTARFKDWTRITELKNGGNVRLQFLTSRNIASEVFAAWAVIPVSRCALPPNGEVELAITDGRQEFDRYKVSAGVFAAARIQLAQSEALASQRQQYVQSASAQLTARDQRSEQYWRDVFRAAKRRVDSARSSLGRARQAEVSFPTLEARDAVTTAQRFLRQQEDALNELDRQASLSSVPREWRE